MVQLPPIRTIMFIPGNNQQFIDNAPGIGADAICLDLEDSIAPEDKLKARAMVKAAIPKIADREKYILFCRVNGYDTNLLEEDLLAVCNEDLDVISLPKGNGPGIIRRVDHYLTLIEKQKGLTPGRIQIAPWIESAEGVLNALEMCQASTRITMASFGSEDFTHDMGIPRTTSSKEVEWANYRVATSCIAAGVIPIAGPEMNYKNENKLRESTDFSKSIGYKGRYCIHPSQVPVVNALFQPTEVEIQEAREIIRTYENAEKIGLGATGLDGMVVDRPVYVRALAVIANIEKE
ncbi:MAG: HpcH/HpaI aldolase/citrate lyase family protein [Dehalococcoidia bacterium]